MFEELAHAVWFDAAMSLAVALACGLLVGIEREQDSRERERSRFGGVRTFGLLGLTGGVCGVLVPSAGWLPAVLVVCVVGATVAAAGLIDSWQGRHSGMTTELAGMMVALVGLLAAAPVEPLEPRSRWMIAGAMAVATMGLLSLRGPLHRLAQQLSRDDIYATAKLGALLLLVLPILPREPVPRLETVVPFEVGLLVALIAGIGFVGYVASRALGTDRGLLLTGAVGGMVSSTAVALNLSGRAKETPLVAPVAALGISLACAIMFPRQLLEVALVAPQLLPRIAGPLGACTLAALGLTAVLWIRHGREDHAGSEVELKNPFSISEALRFAVIFVVVLVLSEQLQLWMGDAGVFLSAILAGTTDVDAITLSVARMSRDELAADVAVSALLLAAASNTLTKSVMVLVLGGWQVGWRVLLVLGGSLLVGGGVLLLQGSVL